MNQSRLYGKESTLQLKAAEKSPSNPREANGLNTSTMKCRKRATAAEISSISLFKIVLPVDYFLFWEHSMQIATNFTP
jgi:hypothetical protein